MSADLFVLIDAHALIYRAYYAFPTLTTKSGLLINAAYGFTRILLTVIRDLEPKYIATAFDLPKPTFRHTEFAGYKAQRKEMPQELQGQIDLVKEVVHALNIPLLAVEGYEADDVIGTMVSKLTEQQVDCQIAVNIVTGDKDSFQLVTDCVHIWMPGNGKKPNMDYGPGDVIKKMGVRPEQIIDFKALAGDPSDNIPGIKGIGQKTAVKLLLEFGSIDNMYQEISQKSDKATQSKTLKGSVLKKIVEGYESAKMSQKLATIDQHVPLTVHMEDCRLAGYDKQQALEVFKKYEFDSLTKYLPADDFELGVQEAFL